MKNINIFKSNSYVDLEDKLNKFIDKIDPYHQRINEIAYSTTSEDGGVAYSCLIFLEEGDFINY